VYSPSLPGCSRFSCESCQNTFRDLQLIELSTQLFPFDVEPRIGKSDDLLQALLKAGRQWVAENVA
jgi:hypothetical protein